jgi:hypothetical protein
MGTITNQPTPSSPIEGHVFVNDAATSDGNTGISADQKTSTTGG